MQNHLEVKLGKKTDRKGPVIFSEYKRGEAIKKALSMSREDILFELKDSKLKGRGGAGFPTSTKWMLTAAAKAEKKFIICNADEGEPGTFKDRVLLMEYPELVFDGMVVGGYTIGAQLGIVYLRGEYEYLLKPLEDYLEEMRKDNLLGKNILGKEGFDFDIEIVLGSGAYVCGEETALIESLEGHRGEPRNRPPYPINTGFLGRPTSVNNVETLAAVYGILKHGGTAYAKLGTAKSKGTKLVCLDSFFNNPGIYEVEMGTPLSTIIYEMGGGFKTPVKAMQIGGPLGGIVPISKIEALTLDFESFAQNGFLLGHASVVCIPEKYPMMNYLEHLFDFASYESCGKCFPCRLGTKRGQEMTHKALNSDYKIDRKLFQDLLTTLQKGSLCAHGGGIPLPVQNALTYFDDELKPYFS